jgi:23S rRNA pseudouridine1911/1915/1917 synthase
MSTAWQWVVAAGDGTPRLDTFLLTRLPALSRREIVDLIAQGHVHLNRRVGKKGTRVRPGDTVTATACVSLPPNATLPVRVVYADETLACLDKPVGLPSLAVRMSETATAANFLAAHYPDALTAGPRVLEAGLVHRLDTAASGLLLAARTPTAYVSLQEQFQARLIGKHYLALVSGHLQAGGRMRFFLAPSGPRGRRMRVVPHACGQEAISIYTSVESRSDCTLVRVTIQTGVRHQIRAHLAALGHPVVGDTVYASPQQIGRLYLHAEALDFVHPATNQRMRLISPAPPDFANVTTQVTSVEEKKV